MVLVLFGEDHLVHRHLPIDIERGVGKEYSTVDLGVIELVALIGEDSRFAEDRETMCKAFGDKELAMILFVEFDGEPLTVGGTILAQIDRDVEDATSCAANELGLGVWWALEMETTHDAVGRAGLIILHELGHDAGIVVALLVIGLDEIPALVFIHLRLDDKQAFDGSCDYIHNSAISYQLSAISYMATRTVIRIPFRCQGPSLVPVPGAYRCVSRRTYSIRKSLKIFSIPAVISI